MLVRIVCKVLRGSGDLGERIGLTLPIFDEKTQNNLTIGDKKKKKKKKKKPDNPTMYSIQSVLSDKSPDLST